MDNCIWADAGEEWGYWETSCNNAFVLIDGTPYENKMRFCPYCGKPLEEAEAQEESTNE